MNRRLAAIVAADVAGYSRLIGTDEEGTVRALQGHQSVLFPLIRDSGGAVINTAGDSILAEFPSVVAAVRTAVAAQELMATRNGNVAPERRLQFRIGVNQGEIIADRDEVYGDGINVAARLQALAAPGGIAISGRVHEDVAGKLHISWRDAGEQTLKNIARPVKVWHWENSHEAPPIGPELPDRPSVAVLPFDNWGGQPDAAFFSDGITEDIITGLARFRSLFVVARNSSFAFRGKPTSTAEIGRQLGVSYILEGSVRRSGERIRITAQLVEASTGKHVWADRYDRSLTEVFEVQDEVATMIVSTLVGRIEDAKFEDAIRQPTSSLAAYDLVQRGKVMFRGYQTDANSQACALFEQAIARDPLYAQAHSYLALARLALHGYSFAPREDKQASAALAKRGVELDPRDGTCHRILGHILLYVREYDVAEHHARRSIDLNPNDADCVVSMGFMLVVRGRAAEGIGWIEKAMRLNPFHPPWYHVQLAPALYQLRRFEEAAQALRRAPHISGWSVQLAACYGQMGRTAEAKAEVDLVLHAQPGFSTGYWIDNVMLLERAEDRALLREGMLKAGLPE
jgi:TolB-like protein/class 3 adenylate cyclase/Tfp pilus assembly protein PilF